MTYQECLDYLAGLGHELLGVEFRLETITSILASLGDPHLKYPTAIVAGTNGKGSTSAILASILSRAGYRTGLYTSPHLIRVNERIAVDGEEISDEDFARGFREVRQAVERLLAARTLPARPSFFEFLTAVAFLHFAQARAGFAVLEVGLGGRLDATNVTEPRVAVITNIELDHQEILGKTHAAIAREKAGVIKPGRPVVSGVSHPEAAEVIRQRSKELGAPLIETASLSRILNLHSRQGRYQFDFALNGDHFTNLILPFLGRFQVENAVAAVTAALELRQEGLRIDRAAIFEGLRYASWPGRLEAVRERPLVLLDGAHNPAGAAEVAAFVREHLSGRVLRLVYASLRDKDIGEISKILFPLAAEVYLTRLPQARAATPQEILAAARWQSSRLTIEPDPGQALRRALEASAPDDVVLAAGSLYLVGALKTALRAADFETFATPQSRPATRA
ncbi:MAG: bifunctional folylpolyglutamate synthase/dihydrofolate synthase [Acidobacteriia bacterium]|nr:bifunctional folylpolyglutamate synthase/dihydrofolate synthase [Terriglobia bacterium]